MAGRRRRSRPRGLRQRDSGRGLERLGRRHGRRQRATRHYAWLLRPRRHSESFDCYGYGH
jgi:hypothetical protein